MDVRGRLRTTKRETLRHRTKKDVGAVYRRRKEPANIGTEKRETVGLTRLTRKSEISTNFKVGHRRDMYLKSLGKSYTSIQGWRELTVKGRRLITSMTFIYL